MARSAPRTLRFNEIKAIRGTTDPTGYDTPCLIFSDASQTDGARHVEALTPFQVFSALSRAATLPETALLEIRPHAEYGEERPDPVFMPKQEATRAHRAWLLAHSPSPSIKLN